MILSPIKDPYNFQCARALKNIIPERSTINVPIFFSGNLEFSLASSGYNIRAITNKYVVYEFWKCAFHDPTRIIKIAEHVYANRDKNMLFYLQEDWPKYKDPYLRSALFFLLNRFSASGYQSHGALSYDNYNPISLSRLRKISDHNLDLHLIAEDDFLSNLDSLPASDHILMPIGAFKYNFFQEGQSSGWETTQVDHSKVRDFLKATAKRTLLAYNIHPALSSFYKDFDKTYLNEYGSTVKDPKAAKEVLIANFRTS